MQTQDGALQCTPGAGTIQSKAEFGDCQLHIEWSAPTEIKGNGQGRGNSGVFLMGKTEVQVLDRGQADEKEEQEEEEEAAAASSAAS